jgi:hypothetical protein
MEHRIVEKEDLTRINHAQDFISGIADFLPVGQKTLKDLRLTDVRDQLFN